MSIKRGDFFSEESHYIFLCEHEGSYKFKHVESGEDVVLGRKYVQELLTDGSNYTSQVTVTKEDVIREGITIQGIRSIFESIQGGTAFTVCFVKQPKTKTYSQIEEEKKILMETAKSLLDRAEDTVESVKKRALQVAKILCDNPVYTESPGEERVLTGYKKQFSSRDGRYLCYDVELKESRPVNINTIKWLILNGVKYVVGK